MKMSYKPAYSANVEATTRQASE